MKTKLTDDKLERAGQIFPLARALPRSTGTPGSTAGGPCFCRAVLTWPFWYTLYMWMTSLWQVVAHTHQTTQGPFASKLRDTRPRFNPTVLDVQFERDSCGLRMHQTQYALSILHQFQMEQCAPCHTPLPEGMVLSKYTSMPLVDATLYRMLVGKLLFLTKTRPDLAYVVSVVSRFMQNPQETHLQAAKHILRYLRRYRYLALFFEHGEENHLQGYTDADYSQDTDDRISVGAYIYFFGNSPISWNSKKQSSTSRSSCESEYRALAQCSCEAIWIRRLLQELKLLDDKPTILYCDNQSSIKLSYNPLFHDKSRHFEIDYHFTPQKVILRSSVDEAASRTSCPNHRTSLHCSQKCSKDGRRAPLQFLHPQTSTALPSPLNAPKGATWTTPIHSQPAPAEKGNAHRALKGTGPDPAYPLEPLPVRPTPRFNPHNLYKHDSPDEVSTKVKCSLFDGKEAKYDQAPIHRSEGATTLPLHYLRFSKDCS